MRLKLVGNWYWYDTILINKSYPSLQQLILHHPNWNLDISRLLLTVFFPATAAPLPVPSASCTFPSLQLPLFEGKPFARCKRGVKAQRLKALPWEVTGIVASWKWATLASALAFRTYHYRNPTVQLSLKCSSKIFRGEGWGRGANVLLLSRTSYNNRVCLKLDLPYFLLSGKVAAFFLNWCPVLVAHIKQFYAEDYQ